MQRERWIGARPGLKRCIGSLAVIATEPELPLVEPNAFCATWTIAEPAVSGSYLRDVVRTEQELEAIAGRGARLHLRRASEGCRNRIRRDATLSWERPAVSE